MSFDLFKPFRSCFYCKCKRDLLRVEMGGYTTEFIYYHPFCLREVLANPEKYFKVLDTAIHIQDEVEKDIRNRYDQHGAQIARARALYSRSYAHVEPTLQPEFTIPRQGSGGGVVMVSRVTGTVQESEELLQNIQNRLIDNPNKIACKDRYDPSPETPSDSTPSSDGPRGRYSIVSKS